MRAAVVTRYGAPEVVEVCTLPRPALGDTDVLIRVCATTVSSGDARVRGRRVPEGMGLLMRLALGWSRPRNPILGTDCSGVVEAVGAKVSRVKPGDAVVAFTGATMGAHAEFVRVSGAAPIAPKPARLTHGEAASLLFGGITAYHYLHRAAQLAARDRVLIVGAAGAVGSAAVQLAHLAGAHVTAVCRSVNHARVTGLGADAAIDYTRDDFTRGEARYDVIFDCVGATDYAACAKALAPGGRLLRAVAGLGAQLAAPFQGRLSGHRVIAGVTPELQTDLDRLMALAASGALRPVIDDTLGLEDVVAAHRRVDEGHKRGNLVLLLDPR
ncbi:MAG: NAD(P)-dependent alcohol dehydrogenase [Myxococcales bacterium]|nr:NAD(P)-dependent alcohol dehydrogenase [Myxococcales bacterium]